MTNTVQHRPGGTGRLAGRDVARIGYGAMQLVERGDRPQLDEAAAVAVLRRARELGVDHLDTAQFYGDGVANAFIRAALHPYDDALTLVSKVGAERRPGDGLVPAQRPTELRAQVEANLRTLGADRLAAVNLRRMDARPGIVADGDQLVDLDSQLAELVALRDEGKIGGIGLSNVSAEQVQAALPVGPVCVQNADNLLDRHDGLLALCAAHDIAWVPFFPLGSAFPGAAKVVGDATVQRVAARLGVTPAQVGLAWLLARDPHVLLICGTADVGHLAENVAAGSVELDAAALAELDAVA
ncbi:aldo/keto reductase [uncultured Jatrophihabitans sp.]|uniref:aldo/keto reductase n=1 Tax=uncultured Jatrophihabitans sp. TaxID=1610747 RepID=UPI0035CB0563